MKITIRMFRRHGRTILNQFRFNSIHLNLALLTSAQAHLCLFGFMMYVMVCRGAQIVSFDTPFGGISVSRTPTPPRDMFPASTEEEKSNA